MHQRGMAAWSAFNQMWLLLLSWEFSIEHLSSLLRSARSGVIPGQLGIDNWLVWERRSPWRFWWLQCRPPPDFLHWTVFIEQYSSNRLHATHRQVEKCAGDVWLRALSQRTQGEIGRETEACYPLRTLPARPKSHHYHTVQFYGSEVKNPEHKVGELAHGVVTRDWHLKIFGINTLCSG